MSNASHVPGASGLGNRRAYRRADLRSRVALCSEFGPISVIARDVSPVGLGVEAEFTLAPGAFVSVAFALPSGVVIEAHAEVARSAPPTLGLKFHGLRQEERRELSAYCESWRRELLERCSQRTGFARKPIAVVPNSTSPGAVRTEDSPIADGADSAVRVKVSRIVAVTDDQERSASVAHSLSRRRPDP